MTLAPPRPARIRPRWRAGDKALGGPPRGGRARGSKGGSDSHHTEIGASGASPAESATKTRRVLIIDDERSIRLLCGINLRLAGMDVLEAPDGIGGLELARGERVDLVLLDVMMPGLNGLEVAAALRSDERTRDVPVIFLSARADHADAARGYALGALGYVTKPFDPLTLAAEVEATIARVERGEAEQLRRERMTDFEQ